MRELRRSIVRLRATCGIPFFGLLASSLVVVIALSAVHFADASPSSGGAVVEPPPATSVFSSRGADLFAKNCAACHGATGRGDGPAAALLDPKARDFSTGRFRIISTRSGAPSDEDLFAVLTRGMPGSSMPPWSHFPEADRWALVHEVRRLAVNGLAERIASPEEGGEPTAESARKMAVERMDPGETIVPPRSPVDTLEGLFHGRRLYVANCLPCHGPAGRGDGTTEQRDESGFPTRPRDLTRGIFKGKSAPSDIWKRIRLGMPGSPMPAAATLDDESIWRLVQYVRSLVPPQVEGQFLQSRQEIVAVRTHGALPIDPGASEWALSKPIYVALAPLSWRDVRPEGVLVEALHDGDSIAFRLTWEDATRNDARGESDAVAMQFALGPDEPLMAMGEATSPVALWYWRAAWDTDVEGRPAEIDAAVMPTAELRRAHAVQALTARGFATLADSKEAAFRALGVGRYGNSEWGDPSWRVVLRRSFTGLDDRAADVTFGAGRRIPVGFAVWDGAAGDRGGQKSFSIWHDLVIESP